MNNSQVKASDDQGKEVHSPSRGIFKDKGRTPQAEESSGTKFPGQETSGWQGSGECDGFHFGNVD